MKESDESHIDIKSIACNCPYFLQKATDVSEKAMTMNCSDRIAKNIENNTKIDTYAFNWDRAQAFGFFLAAVMCTFVIHDAIVGVDINGLHFAMLGIAGLMILIGGK